jgi:hypothetical protein
MITSPTGEVCRAEARQGEVKTKIPKPTVVPYRALLISDVYGF